MATDCLSGPREILQAQGHASVLIGTCGILVPVNDAAAMSEGLRRACDASLTRGLVERGRQRATEFSVATSVERYWSIIEDAMRERRATPIGIQARRTA